MHARQAAFGVRGVRLVGAASNDLMKPLGMDRPEPEPRVWLAKAPVARVLGAILATAVGALALYLTFVDDPLGGEPHALVPIEGEPAKIAAREAPGESARPAPPSAGPAAPGEPRAHASASEVEAQSGVSVVRPEGAAAPSAVIIQVPDAAPGKLRPAPDERLVERSAHGLLPKIGADGSRPAKVYARPSDALLAGGARPSARVALVVGGLGIGQTATADAVSRLPAAVTLAFAPYGSDLERHVAAARDDGHEVMLQVPMEPFDYPDNDPGPHTLTAHAKAQDNVGRLHWVMSRFTGYVGIVNFMGGKLTADEAALAPILREIGGRGLVFLDDGSSTRSVVGKIGASVQAPTARADLVLDGTPRPDAVDRQLERLEQMARQRGFAIGSASALPVTVDRIAQWARTLEQRGVLLVPVTSAYEGGR
jgi:polysaccharide deacetylase 2 family uncharacterized protein YibQ